MIFHVLLNTAHEALSDNTDIILVLRMIERLVEVAKDSNPAQNVVDTSEYLQEMLSELQTRVKTGSLLVARKNTGHSYTIPLFHNSVSRYQMHQERGYTHHLQ